MADRLWRTSLGLVAVLLWSAVVGLPVLLFHLNNQGMDFGERLHAVFMFVASQVLVYWLAARPTKNTPATAVSLNSQIATPFVTIPARYQVWDAELVEKKSTDSTSASVSNTDSAKVNTADSPGQCTAKLIVTNYLGSSQSRIVYVEPGGTQRSLLPGQELEVTATAQGLVPSFRIVESEIATQVYVDGASVAVANIPSGAALKERLDS